jgi:hypothetical protein
MKFFLTGVIIALLSTANVHAAGHVGQCAGPKTRVAKNGYLEFTNPVFIYGGPEESANKTALKHANSAFTVTKESKGFIQLQEVEGWQEPNPNAGEVIGWGKLKDFRFLALRNCN